MNPDIWGPKFWFSLHSVTFDYPIKPDVSEKIRIRDFFNSLEYILPCRICRVNYSKHIREIPIENNLSSRKKLVYWLIDIHNSVNAMHGKPLLSYDEVISIYEKIYKRKIILENEPDQMMISNEIEKHENCKNPIQKKNYNIIPVNNDKKYIIGISISSILLFLSVIIFIFLLIKKNKK